MKASKYLLPTLRETPADAELPSHKLMLQAGMIRKVASGVYEYLPLGFKVLQKVEEVVREEMNRSGGLEIRLPIIQPADLWKETGRWEDFGPEMFKLRDRKQQQFTLGPTHEEVITDLARREIDSYKDLPITLYQINDKYRDEIRPRYGVMRSREFLMKDAYSFHASQKSLEETYQEMYRCYGRIFDRCGLDWSAVEASSGLMGGKISHEFMALSEHGGEKVALCPDCGYSANANIADRASPESRESEEIPKEREKVHTPDQKTAEEVANYLDTNRSKIAKTFIYRADGKYIAVVIRGDHDLEETKLFNHLGTQNVEMVSDSAEIKKVTGADFGSIGPVGLDLPLYADKSLRGVNNLVTGANENGYHYVNVNWDRDLPRVDFLDLRKVQEGDLCPDCRGVLQFERGIEVGQLFQLGTKYSKSLEANYQDKEGNLHPIIMGCYGIGVSRIITAVIEQYHDENGITWPPSLAPFQADVISLSGPSSQESEIAEGIYDNLLEAGLDTLLDDRDTSPGVKFNDCDLIGIPLKVIVGPRGLEKGLVEIEHRSGEKSEISLDSGLEKVVKTVKEHWERL